MQRITAQSLFSCSVFAGKSSIYGPVLSRCTAGGGELCLGNEKEEEEEEKEKEKEEEKEKKGELRLEEEKENCV